VCGDAPRSSRSIYCEKPACKQRAYRLRHQPQATLDLAVLRTQLQHQRLLVAHTIYECGSCGERFLGERRCPDCHLFTRSLGLGGSCPDCDTIILLGDLLELEIEVPS
jgi:ribosomal protein L32